MNFRTETIAGDVAAIRADGRLNMVSAPLLRQVVSDAITAGSVRIVVDLSGVDFMDSSGLGALIGGLKLARQAGGDLRIAGATPQVALVFELTHLDRILQNHATAETAYRD
ncbi:anti-sigma factor antagonist [Cryobacterium algoricola]|uniref:Anti-sigma factor antagonist n=1 Tax=Cryobacterium algoricola TaxID=1259183 RepID=A0ABY2IB26_9MICO|nr:STAS domain-containing protein [Cryobacterium algoricola]TFB86393.1 anti-sigma factor antagonist [Cryobacterium algoricola]